MADRRPGPEHFQRSPSSLGEKGFTLAVGPISVRFEGLDDRLLTPALARYRLFLTEAAPLHTASLHQGQDGYLEPSPDGYLRLEEETRGRERYLLSHDFAALRVDDRGRILVSSPNDGEVTLRALENYLRWIVADLALQYQGFVLHAAGLVRAGLAYLFIGPSGAGKSTLASLSPGCSLLSDDLVLLLRHQGSWRAATTPFAGSLPQNAKDSGSYPISGLFSLVQAPEHSVLPVGSVAQAVAMVLACCPFVADPAARRDRLAPLVEACCREIPPRELRFRMDSGFWALIT